MNFLCKKNNSGVVIIIVLWILVILSVLAIGLGRKSQIELALIKYSIGKLKSRHIAWGGLMAALGYIQKDTLDDTMSKKDTLYACGLAIGGNTKPEDILKDAPLGQGKFDIKYRQYEDSHTQKKTYYGFVDEERKININAVTAQNYKVIKELITILGIDDSAAESIAASIVDWKDKDIKKTNSANGTEEDCHQGISISNQCKNLAFDSIEELLLIRGMTEELYLKLKNFVTIFPKNPAILLVNLNTAPRTVIRAMTRNFSGAKTNTEKEDADSLSDKILAYRSGEDGQIMTSDDRLIDINALALNAKEKAIFLTLLPSLTNVSRYLRVNVNGIDKASKVESSLEAVIFRDDLSIVFWRRD